MKARTAVETQFYGGNFNKKCVQCPTLCTACVDADTCTECLGGFSILNGKCQTRDGNIKKIQTNKKKLNF